MALAAHQAEEDAETDWIINMVRESGVRTIGDRKPRPELTGEPTDDDSDTA